MTAAEVLDRHRKLAEQMRDPVIQSYIDDVLESVRKSAVKTGGEAQALRVIGNMVHPASSLAEFRGFLERDLKTAQTFQVTAEMVDTVSAVYEKSKESVITVHEEELPALAGFIWLDKAMLMPDKNGKTVSNRAVSWGPQDITYNDGAVKPGIRVTTWFCVHDRDDFFDDLEDARWSEAHPDLDVLYSHTVILGFGERIGTAFPDSDGPDRYDFLMWLHTLWAFMDTDIVTSPRQDIPRAFRRRAERVLKEPAVRVVALRRVTPAMPCGEADEMAHREADWSVRWVVQGHYRHLEDYEGLSHHAAPDYTEKAKKCALCGSRITWVHAYIKGPEGKPLRVYSDTVYRLSR